MPLQNRISSVHCILILIQLLGTIFKSCESEVPLTVDDLKTKYGQEGTTFNDGKSCNRVCDGRVLSCYYEFHVEMYDTMSGLCGACGNGTISDCFLNGCITANGVARSMMTINHQMPGPPINVCKDDRIIVDVTNHIAGQELSIHWHGLHQKETPWSDGVPMVTQCPIMAGNTFRYIFYARQAGTHYYHSHSGLQRTNGVIGKLDIRDPFDPNEPFYDYDLPQHSVLLSDWNNELAEENAPGSSSHSVHPDSVLINGFGNYRDIHTGHSKYAPIAVFTVEKGKRHRFRIDNAASHNCPFEFSIQNHTLTVIATDGYPVEPIVVDTVVLSAGERYDVVMQAMENYQSTSTLMVVRALDQCSDYKIQAFGRVIYVDYIKDFVVKPEFHEPIEPELDYYETQNIPNKIILNNPHLDCTKPGSYCVASLQQKQVESTVGGDLRKETAKVIPFIFNNALVTYRPSHYLSVGGFAMVGTINRISFTATPMPGLTQNDSAIKYCNEDNKHEHNCDTETVCHCPHLIQLELCQVYEFLLISGGHLRGRVNHPVHLHGYGFQVVNMGTLDQLNSGWSAYTNATHLPVVKDTVIVPSGGFVQIRFRACNPGYWFFHCHFEYHMHIGMSATIKVGNDTDMPQPPPNFPTCGHYLMPAYELFDRDDSYRKLTVD